MQDSTIRPYKKGNTSKKEEVRAMFNNIAHRYDFLNHFLSLGIDKIWRRKAIRILQKHNPAHILDVATGTGDFAVMARKLNPEKITGIDISSGMLEVGRKKIHSKKLDELIELQLGDSENLPFEDQCFDSVIVAFGVRNFENLNKGLKEMQRVLKKGGIVLILEFSIPTNWLFKSLYNIYFFKILPFFGRLFSKDKAAYTYLPESVYAFPSGNRFLEMLDNCGFCQNAQKRLSGGIASIYTGIKQ